MSNSNALFKDIPEFNSGTKTYDVLDFNFANNAPSFGGTTDELSLSMSTYDFITSLSIQIELPALTEGGKSRCGIYYLCK